MTILVISSVAPTFEGRGAVAATIARAIGWSLLLSRLAATRLLQR
jgi:hypothetical protein